MYLKIAVLSDLHFADEPNPNCPERLGEFADLLLLRAVHRLNRFLKPDLVLLLGDLVDRGDLAGAEGQLERVRDLVGLLDCPHLVISGNHDGPTDTFHRVFGELPYWLDVGGFRVVPFIDPEEPGWNAHRTETDLERLSAARNDFDGTLLCAQHVPVFPEGRTACPYNYTNSAEVLSSMERAGVTLSVSGHYHPGEGPLGHNGTTLLAAPALCEQPFDYLWVEVHDDGHVDVERHNLSCPPELKLWDCHVHTSLAYCNENMDMRKALALADAFGLEGLVFAEHTAHLYFDRLHYGEGAFWAQGLAGADLQCRMPEYLDMYADARKPNGMLGLEVDCDFRGQPIIREEDAARAEVLIGAIHNLPPAPAGEDRFLAAQDDFMRMTKALVNSNIQVLAHPFRAFRRAKLPLPEHLSEPMAELLRISGIAAEINVHTNDPHPDFIRRCAEKGVPLVFGSDAHNLWEVGEFWPHLQLLKEAGVNVQPGRCPLNPSELRAR